MGLLEQKQIMSVALENPIGLSGLFTASFPYPDCRDAMAQADNKRGFAETLRVFWSLLTASFLHCSVYVVKVANPTGFLG